MCMIFKFERKKFKQNKKMLLRAFLVENDLIMLV